MEEKIEIWKKITGYKKTYEVSNFGRIKNIKKNIILKPQINNHGYCMIALYKNKKFKNYRVHRLVAQAFIPNYDKKPVIDHIDGNKQNNHFKNLRWCTREENNNNPITKYRRLNPIICKELGIIFETITEASKTLNINYSHIKNVLSCKWEQAGGYHWEYADKKAC